MVTVYKTVGSTFRRAGARMLVLAELGDHPFGSAVPSGLGSISGGCLEDDARERARHVMETGRAEAVCYDTTAEADIILGTGMGCQGVVHALIQPLPSTGENPLVHVAHALRDRRAGAMATVCAVQGASQVEVGQFLWLDGTGQDTGTLKDPALARVAASTARDILKTRRSTHGTFLDQDGNLVELFVDAIHLPRSLLICGAGEDAIPLARLGKELGWRVRVVDGRRAYAARERFPGVDELIVCAPREFGSRHRIEPDEAVMLMTHNYLHDVEFLRVALDSPAAYIGVLERVLHFEGVSWRHA